MPDHPPLKLYWSSSLKRGRKNFGDWLSPKLVEYLSGRQLLHVRPNACDLVAIGSLLHRVNYHFWNRRTNIWGTGFLYDHPPVRSHHNIHALRGKLSAGLISNARNCALGDPGLLVDRLFPFHTSVQKRFRLGVIPHYSEQTHPSLDLLRSRFPDLVQLDILSETQDFLASIAACDMIISSSLHGLVIADAFGIPNAWLRISDTVRGGNFKFHDYYSAFNLQPEALTVEQINLDQINKIKDAYRRDQLEQIKKDLLVSFPFKAQP